MKNNIILWTLYYYTFACRRRRLRLHIIVVHSTIPVGKVDGNDDDN
jgi:hypothetical protein